MKPYELEQLQAMRKAGRSFDEIGRALGYAPKTCETQLSTYRRAQGIAKLQASPWSAEEDATLINAREIERKKWRQVARAVGRSENACIARFDILCDQGKADRRKRSYGKGPAPHAVTIDPEALVNSAIYAEAQARRDAVASWLNDPPPGYSALDLKRQGRAP